MATTISIDASEFDDLTRRFGDAAPVVAREMQTAMVRATAAVQSDAMVAVPVDTGTLRRSLTTDVTPLLGRVGTNLPYAPVVEYGRRPGAPMPPQGALADWMRRHGIPAEQEFILRKRIAQRGIKARPFLVPALEKNRDGITREFEAANERVVAQLASGR